MTVKDGWHTLSTGKRVRVTLISREEKVKITVTEESTK